MGSKGRERVCRKVGGVGYVWGIGGVEGSRGSVWLRCVTLWCMACLLRYTGVKFVYCSVNVGCKGLIGV